MPNEMITLDEALHSLRGRPGLVYGQIATSFHNSLSLIIDSAKEKCFSDAEDFDETNVASKLDELRQSDPVTAKEFENCFLEGLNRLEPNNDLPFLIKAGWCLCISLTRDMIFESAIQNHQDSIPNSNTVTVIDHNAIRPESRTIPIYKLLGNINSNESSRRLTLSASDYLIRKNMWRQILGTCTDYLQGNPLLFFGTDNSLEMVRDLLSNLSTMLPPAPNSLMFLKDDPVLKDPVILSLCSSFSNIKVVDASIREFSNGLRELKPKQHSLNLIAATESHEKSFSAFKSIISIVPSEEISEKAFLTHRNELVDSLFKPNTIDWDPYLCNLDLIRDATHEILNAVEESFNTGGTDIQSNILVRGDAGVGKTTTLKRTAVELSKESYTVLWCRRAPMGNWLRIYKQLSDAISEYSNEHEGSKFVLLVDDPWSLRIDPSELVLCFEQCTAKITFLFSLRNTEYFNQGGFSYSLPFKLHHEIEIESTLTEEEFQNITKLLVRIGAVQNDQEGESLVNKIPTKNSDDILCSLWYLIPETRSKLAESLTDEYHRLGSANNSIAAFAQSAHQISGESAQHAYEYVAVTSKFQIGLPMEVLVRALAISYEDFIEIAVDGKPLWGLLYDEEDPENRTVLYRTRNEIVTKVLLELVNGGVGRAGEFRALKTLLASCGEGSQIYRTFALEILVRSSKEIEKSFSYEQGIELFEAAEQAMPHEDRLLAHHKGIWMHRVGREFQKAYKQFEKALESQQYPGSEREAHMEHIHTSMAASVVGLVKSGEQSASQGLQLVQDHIQQATNPKIFNAHTGHVSANLFFEMALQQNSLDMSGVGVSSFSKALNEVEKTLQSLGPIGMNTSRSEKSIEMLKELQEKIIESIPEDDELEEFAYESFDEKRNQVGFELLLRKKFSNAQIVDKGKAYNSVRESIEQVLAHISKTVEKPSVEIFSIRADLVIRWKLQRQRGAIDWEQFRDDLQLILENAIYRDDPIRTFYYAVALFHLGQIEQSNAEFANLRRMQAIGLTPKAIRFYAVGAEGTPKRFQCSISRSHGRSYAEIMELNQDIPVLGSNREIVNHTYIGFCLNGPLAIYDRPDDQRMLLA